MMTTTMMMKSEWSGRGTPRPVALKGVQQLAESRPFKGWLLDQFGVLHDGKLPYPSAISTRPAQLNKRSPDYCKMGSVCAQPFPALYTPETCDQQLWVVEKLALSGAKMVIISNSSRRASTTLDKLKALGFDPSLFVGAITSGELTHHHLLRREDDWFAALGRSCIHITWSGRGVISLEGLDLRVVETVEKADFVLVHGTEALGQSDGASHPMTLEELEKILEKCAAKKIPMVVANPDFVTVEARDLCVMPGTLAAKYEKLGGEVKWMGKPGQIIYEAAMAMAGVEASDCITVGDSLHHDIKGANAAGISSAFITGGIHATELGVSSFGEVADLSAVEALASKCNAHPSYVLPSFTW